MNKLSRVIPFMFALAVAKPTHAQTITPPPVKSTWTDRLHPTGRLRLRYQGEELANDQEGRHRLRFLAQGGLTIDLPENFSAGFGLATGREDPRSNNVTMTDVFRSPEIGLTETYLAYQPTPWFSLGAGKRASQLWVVNDATWDHDLRPTGAYLRLNNPGEKAKLGFPLFFNQSAYVINEDKAKADQWLTQSQLGLHINLGTDCYLRLASEFNYYHRLAGSFLPYSSLSNSRTEVPGEKDEKIKVYSYGFNSLNFLGGLNLTESGGIGISLFGQYLRNLQAASENQVYLGGLTLRFGKIFSLSYVESRLEKDAVWDGQTDSDRYGGKTDTQGEEVVVRYRLNQNFEFGLDFYRQNTIKGEKNKQILGQFDLSVILP
ncbi:MAG: putative porin [Candidatus Margulisiibacteriota bacterium]|jgi:hypothetical protein